MKPPTVHKLQFRAALTACLLAALVAFTGTTSTASAVTCHGADAKPAPPHLPKIKQATLCLINIQRTRRGLRTLKMNPRLERAAHGHSTEMAAENHFSHVSIAGLDLVDRLSNVGYVRPSSSWAVGENIGYGMGPYATPRQMFNGWMASPGHRANIMSRSFQEIGIGVVLGTPVPSRGLPGVTYTTDFGRRG
jgi:uncharacterized protein YkwD